MRTDPTFACLVEIVARLRAPDGCPWDRAQTLQTLRPYVLEEAYEVLDALDRNDLTGLEKELGDVLFQLVLMAQMAKEDGAFDMTDVLQRINDKMVKRHPHVFDPTHTVSGDEGEVAAWEARKAKERPADHSALDGVPGALPALLRAHRISEKASMVGFDWPDLAQVRAKVGEELDELDEALRKDDEAAIVEEYGDLLFALVNLGRHLPVGSEEALRLATRKFEGRFRRLEAHLATDGRTVYDTDADALEAAWQALKGNPC